MAASKAEPIRPRSRPVRCSPLRGAWLVLAGLLLAAAAAAQTPGRVVHVAAGDRLTVATAAGTVDIRLAHVRAPERGHFYWSRARRALGELVFDRRVVVEPLTVTEPGLARLLVDGRDVAALLVSRGLLLTGPGAPAALRSLEAEARRRGLGIWGSGVAPTEPR